MLYKLWFSKMEDSDGIRMKEFFNPNGEGIPFESIALVLAAVCFTHCHRLPLISLQAHNSITEFEKGYYMQKDFTAKECQKYFKYYLDKLNAWQKYTTTKSNSHAAENFRKELWGSLR